MNIEQRKAEIRRRMRLRKYPRRANAQFTDEDDHNPLILADCPECSGVGETCLEKREGNTHSVSQDTCSVCFGSGTAEEIVHYFKNNAPAIEVKASADGWVQCPCCDWKFAVKDANVWTGRRHKRCGQKLNIVRK